MELSSALVKEFASVVNDTNEEVTSSGTAYGTIVSSNGVKYVLLDGATSMTAISEATDAWEGDRVIVTITNHVATVTSNLTSPASGRTATAVSDELTAYYDYINANYITADKIEANYASFNYLATNYLDATTIQSEYATIQYLQSEFGYIDYLESKYINTEELNANFARIESTIIGEAQIEEMIVAHGYITDADIGNLNARIASIEEAYVNYAEIERLEAELAEINQAFIDYASVLYADIEELYANLAVIQDAYITKASVNELLAGYAQIADLDAAYASISNLDASIANITYLLSGEVGVGTLETIHLTADNVIIDSAVITDALVGTILVDIINSNVIYTDQITIMSEDGGIYIVGNQMQFTNGQIQFYDSNGTVRVQIGQDASGNFTFILYDETGEGILLDSEGIHASAIPDGLIVDSMVAADANISADKINMQEVTKYLNSSGDLVLDAYQIYIDGTTLDYKLTEITESAVSEVINYYAIGPSPDEPPCEHDDTIYDAICGLAICGLSYVNTIGWTTRRLYVDGEGQYLWFVQKKIYVDGSYSWTEPTCLTDNYTRTKVSTAVTELDVVQGQIEARVWLTDIEEATGVLGDQITTITDQYGDLIVTVNEIDERVGLLTTSIGEDFEYLYSEVANITVLINEIDEGLSQVYSYVDDELEIMSDQISGIQILIDEINIGISDVYSYVDTEVGYVSSSVTDVIINLESINASLSNLESLESEHYTYLYDQYSGIAIDLDSVVTRIEVVESEAGEAIKRRKPFFAISYSPDYYPSRSALESAAEEYGFDTILVLDSLHTAICGLAICGLAVCGNTGLWTEEQPIPEEGEYVWVCYLVETISGDIYWEDPILLSDETARKEISYMSERYAEVVVSLDEINLEIYSLYSDLDSFSERFATIDLTLDEINLEIYNFSSDLDFMVEQITAIDMELGSMSFTVYDSGYGMASIVMTVGDRTETADVVTNAREAFENDDSEIFIQAGKIAFGSGTFEVNSTHFTVTSDGVIGATSGQIGPWNLTDSSISTGSYNTSGAMYFGTSGLSLGETFSVTFDGVLTAKSGTVGGFSISSTKIYGHDSTAGDPSSSNKTACAFQIPISNNTWALAIGSSSHNSYDDAAFRVDKYGNAYAESLTVYDYLTMYNGAYTAKIAFKGSSSVLDVPCQIDCISVYATDYLQTRNIDASGYLSVIGTASVSSTLSVKGATTLSSSLSVSGATTLSSTLSVDGTAEFNNARVRVYNSPYGISLYADSSGNEGLYDKPVSATSVEWILRFVRNSSSDNAGATFLPQVPTYSSTTGSANVRMGGAGRLYYLTGSSSVRYKNIIRKMEYSEVEKYYDLPIHWFTYKPDYVKEGDERYMVPLPGFIAEEWNELLPAAVDHNDDGQCEVWNSNIVVPIMFEMIKYNHTTIETVEDRMDVLQLEIDQLKKENAELKQELADMKAA